MVTVYFVQKEFDGAYGLLPVPISGYTPIREPAAAPAGRSGTVAIQFLFQAALRKLSSKLGPTSSYPSASI